MKKSFAYLILLLVLFSACKSEEKTENKDNKNNTETLNTAKKQIATDSPRTISGEFIYSDEAAVIKRQNTMYGVIMNDKAKTLLAQAKGISDDPYATFNVTVTAKVEDNNGEGWEKLLDIQKIIKVEKLDNGDSLRLE
ncbi:hypothetical protein [Psychroflexus aestuariivivens]|uniref:hypothetical protein n=1 Tax=Psychroflexus aestuariivivens TaxID=1795040 RepID=UPI000FDACCEC|nr:hypothetical protein [Psychroflexus aestuariivivens]